MIKVNFLEVLGMRSVGFSSFGLAICNERSGHPVSRSILQDTGQGTPRDPDEEPHVSGDEKVAELRWRCAESRCGSTRLVSKGTGVMHIIILKYVNN